MCILIATRHHFQNGVLQDETNKTTRSCKGRDNARVFAHKVQEQLNLT